jgi:AcrR family transcriptional regulator
MVRPIPQDRLRRLVEVATAIFIDRGFRHTRMDDVAEALEVAKGTLYLYVESKEALFDLVCRSADRPFEQPAELPVKTPPPRATLQHIVERLAAGQVMPALAEALTARRRSTRDELGAIVGDIYDALARNRVGIKVVDRAARDIPELGQIWFGGARGALVDTLSHYLSERMGAGRVRSLADVGIAARFVVETCAFWAVHRHWDSGRQDLPEERVRAAVVDLVTTALIEPARLGSASRGKGRKS